MTSGKAAVQGKVRRYLHASPRQVRSKDGHKRLELPIEGGRERKGKEEEEVEGRRAGRRRVGKVAEEERDNGKREAGERGRKKKREEGYHKRKKRGRGNMQRGREG